MALHSGISTIFRVFTDKDEVLQACMTEAINPDHALRELASISLDEPLTARLVQAAEALRAHLERMGTVAAALYTSGHRRDRAAVGRPAPGGREASMKATLAAVAELIEPDRAALRLDPQQVAAVFLGLLFARTRPMDAELTPSDLVGVLLNGVCYPSEAAR
ncbi:TetR family transcriptional regulator [Acrocarpospora corrugata]|uniref:TetR family transcriptional regulator n=1 Tax=Acrocarpospora corrugata TaxID=35763 RepID=A0A5M3VUJ3_9ACTN|nr:TetR family transcriptional regulator [Acrocarpospora corrugata]GES00246.1 TetR family transcriptional regulator [Acrocarpospora corrugata]